MVNAKHNEVGCKGKEAGDVVLYAKITAMIYARLAKVKTVFKVLEQGIIKDMQDQPFTILYN